MASFKNYLFYIFKRNKYSLSLFFVWVLLNILLALIAPGLALPCFSVLVISVPILIILVLVHELKTMYVLLNNNNLSQKSTFLTSAIAISLVFTAVITLAFLCCGLSLNAAMRTDFFGVLSPQQIIEVEENISNEELSTAINTLGNSLLNKGYASFSLLLSFYVASLVTTVSSVFEWHAITVIVAKFKVNPIITIIFSMMIFSLLHTFILSLLASLLELCAPGISSAIAEISAVTNINTSAGTNEVIISFAKSLPEASSVIKTLLINSLCTVVVIFTDGLIALKLLKNKIRKY